MTPVHVNADVSKSTESLTAQGFFSPLGSRHEPKFTELPKSFFAPSLAPDLQGIRKTPGSPWGSGAWAMSCCLPIPMARCSALLSREGGKAGSGSLARR